jgi:hypothetical protein
VSDLPLLHPDAEPADGFDESEGLGLDDLVGSGPLEPGPDDPSPDEAEPDDGEPLNPPAVAAARARRNRWLLIGALAVTLVLVAAALISWRLLTGPGTSLSTPDTVAGLRLETDADTTQTTDYLRDALAADASLGGAVGAVYSDPANADRRVLLFGGTGSIKSPESKLDSAFGLLNDQTGDVTGIRAVTPGPLGGVVKCGTSNGDGAPISVCGWADDSSLALALFPGRSMDEAAGLMLQLRAAVEHR